MTQRLFLQGLVAGAFGTLLGGAALLYTLARLQLIRLHDTAVSTPGDWLVVDPTVDACIKGQAAKWRFSAPKDEGKPTSADFEVPLLLKPGA